MLQLKPCSGKLFHSSFMTHSPLYQDCGSAQAARQGVGPALALVTPYDTLSEAWTRQRPSAAIMRRAAALAARSLTILRVSAVLVVSVPVKYFLKLVCNRGEACYEAAFDCAAALSRLYFPSV